MNRLVVSGTLNLLQRKVLGSDLYGRLTRPHDTPAHNRVVIRIGGSNDSLREHGGHHNRVRLGAEGLFIEEHAA
eukprot:5529555-Pyramimonas_sp.AAC.1